MTDVCFFFGCNECFLCKGCIECDRFSCKCTEQDYKKHNERVKIEKSEAAVDRAFEAKIP